MDDRWAIRVDGRPSALPIHAQTKLDALAAAARLRLGLPSEVCFVEARSLPGGCVVTAAIGPLHANVRAQRPGRTIDEAVAACSDSIGSRLDLLASGLSGLSLRPPVCEALLHTWILPADGRAQSPEALARARDERFAYHLSDEEAIVRAELAGDPFYFYGAKGLCLSRALLRVAGAWHRLDDVERPAWQLPLGRDGAARVTLVPVGGTEAQPTVTLRRSDVIQAPTFAAAAGELSRRKLPLTSAVIADPPITCVLWRESPDWVRAFGYEADVYRIDPDTGPFGVPAWARPASGTTDKTARLREILVCPRCRASLRNDLGRGACSGCGAAFTASPGLVSFLAQPEGRIEHDPGASRNTPSKQLVHDVRLHPGGLVLNVGAGDAHLAAANLVNLEIMAYPATDVVADALALPFADESFDTVFSQSVLEHVKDPFVCAREMQRVLKAGGTLYADAPFIAPFHGYPDHYFNPTMNGLRRLFAELEEVDVREGHHHAARIAVLAVVSRFIMMMRDEESRLRALALPLRDFLDVLDSERVPEISRDLDPRRTFEISAGFSYYGVKRRVPGNDPAGRR